MAHLSEEQLKKAFAEIDQDGNGYLSKEEFQQLFLALKCSVEEAQVVTDAIFKLGDENGDNQLSFDEMKKVMVKITR